MSVRDGAQPAPVDPRRVERLEELSMFHDEELAALKPQIAELLTAMQRLTQRIAKLDQRLDALGRSPASAPDGSNIDPDSQPPHA